MGNAMENGNELWVKIPNTKIPYEVSNFGRVRSVHAKGKVLKPYLTGKNHPYPTVQIDGKNRKVHRLVAEAFIENPNNLPQVNHIDGDKTNNCVSNLEWVSNRDNVNHAFANGLMHTGAKEFGAKLTEEQVRCIRASYKPKTMGCGSKAMAKKYGVSDTTIRNILKGVKWRHDGNVV